VYKRKVQLHQKLIRRSHIWIHTNGADGCWSTNQVIGLFIIFESC